MHQKIITDHSIVMNSRHLSENKSKQLICDFFTIDQEYRKSFMRNIILDDLSEHQKTISKEIEFKKSEAVRRLIQINKGWFVKSVFGGETDNMLWVLVQHMDQDIRYQKYILNILKNLYPIEETNKENYAYLYDRVAMNEKRPQKYGTQFVFDKTLKRFVLYEVANTKMLPKLRKEMGLNPIEEYETLLNQQLLGFAR